MQLLTPIEPPAPAAAPAASNNPPAPAPAARLARVPVPGSKTYLPDGTELRMTISRKVVLGALFDKEEIGENGEPTGKIIGWPGPQNPMEDLLIIFLCATGPETWYQPSLRGDGVAVMLYQDGPAFMALAMQWADESCLAALTLADLYPIAKELWYGSHASQAIPLAEKKTVTGTAEAPPTGVTNTPPSSPEGTPASSTSSCTGSPSPTPTGSSMPGSTTREPSASPPSNEPGGNSNPAP